VAYKIHSTLPNSLIDIGTRTITPPITDRYEPAYRFEFARGSLTTLYLNRLAVVCADGYSGSNCGVMECVPRDDLSGHFSCDSNQNKVCLPGYQDPANNCVEPVGATTTTESNGLPTTQSTITDSTTQSPIISSTTTQYSISGISTTQSLIADSTAKFITDSSTTRSISDSITVHEGPTESPDGPVIGAVGDGLSILDTDPTIQPTIPAPESMVGVAVIGGTIAGLLLILTVFMTITSVAVCLKYKTREPGKSPALNSNTKPY